MKRLVGDSVATTVLIRLPPAKGQYLVEIFLTVADTFKD